MVTSVFLLASWLGCVIISVFGMKMGRRSWVIAGEIVQIIGTVISATSYSYGQLIAGRVLIVCLSWPIAQATQLTSTGRRQRLLHLHDPGLRRRDGHQRQGPWSIGQLHDLLCSSRHRTCLLGVSRFLVHRIPGRMLTSSAVTSE